MRLTSPAGHLFVDDGTKSGAKSPFWSFNTMNWAVLNLHQAYTFQGSTSNNLSPQAITSGNLAVSASLDFNQLSSATLNLPSVSPSFACGQGGESKSKTATALRLCYSLLDQ
jgi:hypothetical protein